jgi:hypothetical protein
MVRFAAAAFAVVTFSAALSARADEVWQTLPPEPPMPKADAGATAASSAWTSPWTIRSV